MKNVVSLKSPMLIKTRERKQNEWHLKYPNLRVGDLLYQSIKAAANVLRLALLPVSQSRETALMPKSLWIEKKGIGYVQSGWSILNH